MAETLKFGNLTIHFLGSNAAQLKSMYNGLYGSAVANTGSPTFRNTISETARYFRSIYVGGSLQDLDEVPGYKDARINPKEVQTRPAFGRPISADTYAMVVTGKEHTLAHGGRTFSGTTELVMAHEFMHPIQLLREWAQTGLPFRRDDTGGPETQVQMREQRIAVELGKVPGRDFPDIIGTETGYEVHLKSLESRPRLPTEIDPVRPQPGVPPIDGGTNQRTPANDAPAKHGALGQIRAAETAYGKTADRLRAGTAPAFGDRPLALSGFGTARVPGPRRDAVAARMAEIKTLMGDRHSEYWQGREGRRLAAGIPRSCRGKREKQGVPREHRALP